MKYIFFLALSIIGLATYSQEITYEQWKEEAKSNIRLLPEYGHIPKTNDQKKADAEFIEAALKNDTTYRKSSDHYVDLGFKYFYKGDIKIAMYRFNQAWLLDSLNENVYWGLGAIFFQFEDFEKAIDLYDKGLSVNPNSSVILTDKATVYLAMLNSHYDEETLKKALDMFDRSLSIDPENQNTLYKLSTVYFSLSQCDKAVRYYNECKKYGGHPITEEYSKALKDKCKL